MRGILAKIIKASETKIKCPGLFAFFDTCKTEEAPTNYIM